uniref:Uncharacterized protein n=1 Tax=Glossina palpalis gambiensis TaxID=67801 RepID=A0A1B0BKJ8_9MUSC
MTACLDGKFTVYLEVMFAKDLTGTQIVTADIADHMKNVRNICFRQSISIAIGNPIKTAKGQPSKVAMAIKNTDNAYICCHQAAKAAQPKYIAKEDGNKAVLDINMPALNS